MSQTARRGHRLSLNENLYGPLPSVHAALTSALVSANRYPEFLPRRQPELIAQRLGFPTEQLVVGPGATGIRSETGYRAVDWRTLRSRTTGMRLLNI